MHLSIGVGVGVGAGVGNRDDRDVVADAVLDFATVLELGDAGVGVEQRALPAAVGALMRGVEARSSICT